MVKNVSYCCVRGSRLFSDLVTYKMIKCSCENVYNVTQTVVIAMYLIMTHIISKSDISIMFHENFNTFKKLMLHCIM